MSNRRLRQAIVEERDSGEPDADRLFEAALAVIDSGDRINPSQTPLRDGFVAVYGRDGHIFTKQEVVADEMERKGYGIVLRHAEDVVRAVCGVEGV